MRQGITLFDPSKIFSDRVVDTFFDSGLTFLSNTNQLEMYDDRDNVVVRLKAPGFKSENIDINFENDVLTISGQISDEKKEEDEKRRYYYREMRDEEFTRSIHLPVRINADKTQAKMDDGMLVITMPKAEEAKPRKINVDVK